MRTRYRVPSVGGVLLFILVAGLHDACAARLGPRVKDSKKIIGFAVNAVEPSYLRKHVADIERLPLDGLNISVYPDDWGATRSGQEGLFFGGRRFLRSDFRKALTDLQHTPFKRLTDNFIQVETSARGSAITGSTADGNLDWFDPQWENISENGAVVAWLARAAGFKGLFLDVEHYTGGLGPWHGEDIFNYAAAPSRRQHSLQETALQVQRRGAQWMQAVQQAYPTITIILIPNTGWHGHGLVQHFVRGMLQTRGQATLIDGGSGAYSHVTHPDVARLRHAAESTHASDKLFSPVQYAFGVWVDPNPNQFGGWHTIETHFDRNYRSPLELENTLYGALTETDQYVWLYVWHPAVWFNPVVRPRPMLGQCQLCPHDEVPEAYLRALTNCRNPHDLDWRPAVSEDRQFYFDDAVLVEGKTIAPHHENLLTNSGLEQWTDEETPQPTHWSVGGEDPLIGRERKIVKSGQSAARITTNRTLGHVLIDMRLSAARFAGKTLTFGSWVHTGIKGASGVEILDFVGTMHEVSSGGGHPGDRRWHFVTVTRTIRPDATGQIVLRLSAHVPFIKKQPAQSGNEPASTPAPQSQCHTETEPAGATGRQILNRALAAAGGARAAARLKSPMMWMERGTLYRPGKPPVSFVAQYAADWPHWYRREVEHGSVFTLNADRAWTAQGADTSILTGSQLEAAIRRGHLAWAERLFPLTDASYTLTRIEGGTSEEKNTVGIEATHREGHTTQLFFDADTYRLAKIATRVVSKPHGATPVLSEALFSRHRSYSGVTMPAMVKLYYDGQLFLEAHTIDYKLGATLDPRQFAPPR